MEEKYNPNADFPHKVHVKYLLRFLQMLPSSLSKCDTTRMTIAYFALSGLDVLNGLDSLDSITKNELIEWIYSLQVINDEDLVSGFQGSSTINTIHNKGTNSLYKWSHIAGTYCALCSLVILGDDLSGVNRKSILNSLKELQLSDGCFKAAKDGTEFDMRFLYCAASICYILNDWSGMDIEKTVEFINKSTSYDHGIAQGPELESHGGSTYCAVAALAMCNRLRSVPQKQYLGLTRWLFNRQIDGFQGRPNKPVDTCYSYWIGATLKILGCFSLSNFNENRAYVLATQNYIIGGFSKWTDGLSDPLHTYLGLAGLSLMEEDGLNAVMPELNITYRAFAHLKHLHEIWL